MQIMGALKHSSEDTDSIQQNNSSPKIFDETCKIQKNARMLVEKVFSFPDKYFTKGWLDDKPPDYGVQKDENSLMNTVQENCPAAVAKSLTQTIGEDKNVIDPVQLNEFLLSVVD
jgi:hypothetical protein